MLIKLSRAAVGVTRHQKPKQEPWSAADTCVWHVSDTCPHLIGMPVGESHWVCENKGRKEFCGWREERTAVEAEYDLECSTDWAGPLAALHTLQHFYKFYTTLH